MFRAAFVLAYGSVGWWFMGKFADGAGYNMFTINFAQIY
jgi:hypothetical protein